MIDTKRIYLVIDTDDKDLVEITNDLFERWEGHLQFQTMVGELKKRFKFDSTDLIDETTALENTQKGLKEKYYLIDEKNDIYKNRYLESK
jgi:hypothetical protein